YLWRALRHRLQHPRIGHDHLIPQGSQLLRDPSRTRSLFDRQPRRFPVSKPATKGGLGHGQPVFLYEIVTVLEHGVSGVLVSQIDTDGSLRRRYLGFGLLSLLLAILLHGWSDLLGTLSAVCA